MPSFVSASELLTAARKINNLGEKGVMVDEDASGVILKISGDQSIRLFNADATTGVPPIPAVFLKKEALQAN